MPAPPQIARDTVVLGLDIGTQLIKVAEVRTSRGQAQVLNIGIRPTPPEVISNGVIIDPQTLGTAIKSLLATQGIRTRQVVLSVAGQSSLVVRPIEVPKMSRDDLAETMKWEVERHIPFAVSEVVMDYQPLVEPETLPESQQNMEVLLAVAQEDMINAYLQTLEVADLRPVAFDIEPLAASRSLIDIEAEKQNAYQETIALVNVGATNTDITIIREGLLSFTRTIPLAGDSITNAISEGLGIDINEAERLKREWGTLMVGQPLGEMPAPEPAALPQAPSMQAPPTPVLDSDLEATQVVRPEAAQPEGEATEAPAAPVFDLSSEIEDALPKRRPPRQIFDLSVEETETPPPEEAAPAEPGAEPTPAAVVPVSFSASTGGDEGTVRRVYEAMMPTMTELVGEIRRSIEYYRTRYPNSNVDRVVLLGGTARLEHLPEFLANELAIPVTVGNPFTPMSFLPPGYSERYLREVACLFPIAVGLGMREAME